MSEHYQASQGVSSSWTNSFTYVNIAKTSSSSWPIRKLFPVHEYSSAVTSQVCVPTAYSNFRAAIMNHAQEMERSKQTPKTVAGYNSRSKKRKSPEAVVQAPSENDEPLTKRLKTVKPNLVETRKHDSDGHTTKKTPVNTTGVSAKTMGKLDAFRFSAQPDQSKDFQQSPSAAEEAASYNTQVDRDGELVATRARYVMKDHSSRLIQSGKEEMAKQSDKPPARVQQSAYFDPHEEALFSAGDAACNQNTDEVYKSNRDTAEPKSRYKMKDCSSKLIRAGIDAAQEQNQISTSISEKHGETANEDEAGLARAPFTQYKMTHHASKLIEADREELAMPAKQHTSLFCEDHDGLQSVHINSAEADDVLADFSDLEDSFFDDPSLYEYGSEKPTTTKATGWTETDEMDESIFDQIIAEDEADWEEAPTSAQVEISRFSSGSVSSPTKPGFMLPPNAPPKGTPSQIVIQADGDGKCAPSGTPIPPFLRPSWAALVTSPSAIPNLHPAGRVVTCFRLAELFRELSGASPPAVIELFATVTASVRRRDGMNQYFTFADLFFPQRPPYVHGVYAKCAESELFDDDSRPFLKAGRGRGMAARAIVRPNFGPGKQLLWTQKDGFHAGEEHSVGAEVEVLSIYVSSWDDVEYTKGIVMPEEEGDKKVFYRLEKKSKFRALQPFNHQQKAALKEISSNLPSSPTTMAGKQK